MTDVPDKLDVGRALLEILKLLDLTRDIERNQDDTKFAQNGGQIHYVFDENVFELLIRPWRWQASAATFYARFWLKAEDRKNLRGWSSIATQSALLTGEYLISGQLPGQHCSKIYLTEWHMWELRQRLGDLIDELRNGVAGASGRKRSTRSIREVPFMDEDLREMSGDGQLWAKEAVDRFVIARKLAHMLSEDEVLEPVRQVQRLVSPPIRNRLTLLDEKFPVPASEFGSLASSAEAWLRRLQNELENNRNHARRSGKMGSLRSDARSLAHVQWAARKCPQNEERVVMVTGDELVFDAYRRWHSDPASPEYHENQPFALRRPVQFAPIFNMNDAESDIRDSGELFEQTRAAVELALLPFNLSQLGLSGDRATSLRRGREYLALRRTNRDALMNDPVIDYFMRSLGDKWLPSSRDNLSSLTQLWRRAERIAIGSMYDLIAPRLTSEQIAIAEGRVEPGAEDLGPALTHHIRGLFDVIVEDSVKVWYPLAAQYIARAVEKANENPQARIRTPINLSFSQRHRSLPANLGDLFNFIRDGQTNRHLLAQAQQEFADLPNQLFAIAAVLALSLGSWSEAERFADLARGSADLMSEDRVSVRDRDELLYLHALTKRFRLGEIGIPRSDGAQRNVDRNFKEASALLTSLLKVSQGEGASDPAPLEIIRRVRALSERAALNLFYFTSQRLDRDGLPRSTMNEQGDAEHIVATAERDLIECVELGEKIEASHLEVDQQEFFNSVRRQYVSNIAAASLLRFITRQGTPPKGLTNSTSISLVGNLSTNDLDRLPYLVRLEIGMFRSLQGLPTLAAPVVPNLDSDRDDTLGAVSLDQALGRALIRLARVNVLKN